jgi:outer membrane protein assembly factor BamB
MNIRLLPSLLLLALTASLHAQSKRPSSLLPPRAPSGGAVAVAGAGDWPQFRGPHRDDVSKETGLLKQWPAEGPKKLWMSDKGGLGYSGFAVVGSTLYTMGTRDDLENLIALDANSGMEKWVAPVGAVFSEKHGDGPRMTPAVDGDRVYGMSGKGELICVSAADGKELWKVSMTGDLGGKVPGWGYTESVLVDGDKVICTPGGPKGTVAALDKMSGKKIWQSEGWTDPAQYSSAIAADVNGTRQYIQLTMQHVGGVDAKTGKTLWLSDWIGRTAVVPTPIYKDGKVFIASGYGVGCKLVDIGSSSAPADVWTNENMVNHHGGVILVGDYLYGFSDKGGWTCMDFNTGEVKWAENKLGKGSIHCADGMLYLLEEKSGSVVLIEASPEGWKEHGRFTLEPLSTQRSSQGKVWTHPVVSHGKLYLRDQENIFCFDVKA